MRTMRTLGLIAAATLSIGLAMGADQVERQLQQLSIARRLLLRRLWHNHLQRLQKQLLQPRPRQAEPCNVDQLRRIQRRDFFEERDQKIQSVGRG
jgi:hypothetical protein